MCLAQGHKAVSPVRLEPAAPRFRVKNSTIEPLRYHIAASTNLATCTIISIHLDLNEIQILRSKDSDYYFNTGVIFFIFLLYVQGIPIKSIQASAPKSALIFI